MGKDKIHVKLEGKEARVLKEVARSLGVPVSIVVKMLINAPGVVLPEIERVKKEMRDEE